MHGGWERRYGDAVSTTAVQTARRIRRSSVVRALARGGYAANGLLHIVIGLIAIGVARGTGLQHADQTGALSALARTPGGLVLLWAMTVTVLALALWHATEAFGVRERSPRRRWVRRLELAAKSAVYLAVALTALTFARGGHADAASSLRRFTLDMIGTTGGVVVLDLIGATLIGVGAFFAVKGATRRFRADIDLPDGVPGRVIVVLGIFGYVAKGVALALVGVLFVLAAVTGDWTEASGLDGALRSLADMPFGVALLGVVAAGFASAGLYYIVRAGRARLG